LWLSIYLSEGLGEDKMKNLRVSVVILVVISNCAIFASYPPPTGLWQFNDANNLAKATIGVNGGVKVYHMAEQKCTTRIIYSQDRPGCQLHS
jgi:hypothetical protein